MKLDIAITHFNQDSKLSRLTNERILHVYLYMYIGVHTVVALIMETQDGVGADSLPSTFTD